MKSSSSSPDHIVVATSFPPKLVRTNAGRQMPDYDRLCVESWIACGFKIISLNAPDEIPALASRYPEVEFIPMPRDASSEFGRETPFIADILAALARESAAVLGIINSDVLFEPAAAWREMAAKAKQAALEKARAKAAANDSGFAERQATRRAVSEAREARAAERKVAKAEAAEREEAARKIEQIERAAAAKAAKEAEAAAAVAAAARAAAAKIESKAARDARYAARKSRKK